MQNNIPRFICAVLYKNLKKIIVLPSWLPQMPYEYFVLQQYLENVGEGLLHAFNFSLNTSPNSKAVYYQRIKHHKLCGTRLAPRFSTQHC